ncbi:MAG: tRNA pseudouridine(38-40) synthase TruA [Firmicutes bacterium]|nr:tRNA pseudouridine(38-40) synthase TruA [Bacillota bacterium]
MRTLRLDLCYDGTRYRGWQRLPDTENTIQGKLENALSRILGEPVEISGSGRTDAGAHALHQIASFSCHSTLPPEEIAAQLNRYLPEDIGIHSCREASGRFHARLNAKRKTYCYRLWVGREKCVFDRKYVYCFPERLDVEAMRRAAQILVGEHDFSAFCARKTKKSTLRRIDEIRIEPVGEELRLTFTGNGFLYNMVRIIVGTLLEVGVGKRRPEDLRTLFGASRAEAGFTAPAQGLWLMEVEY